MFSTLSPQSGTNLGSNERAAASAAQAVEVQFCGLRRALLHQSCGTLMRKLGEVPLIPRDSSLVEAYLKLSASRGHFGYGFVVQNLDRDAPPHPIGVISEADLPGIMKAIHGFAMQGEEHVRQYLASPVWKNLKHGRLILQDQRTWFLYALRNLVQTEGGRVAVMNREMRGNTIIREQLVGALSERTIAEYLVNLFEGRDALLKDTSANDPEPILENNCEQVLGDSTPTQFNENDLIAVANMLLLKPVSALMKKLPEIALMTDNGQTGDSVQHQANTAAANLENCSLAATILSLEGARSEYAIITDNNNGVKGIFTTRDLLTKIFDKILSCNGDNKMIREIFESSITLHMSNPVEMVSPTDTVLDALRLMKRHGYRHLAVAGPSTSDECRPLIGAFSQHDLLQPIIEYLEKTRALYGQMEPIGWMGER
jgi:CBS domain-containing protein